MFDVYTPYVRMQYGQNVIIVFDVHSDNWK